MNEKVRYGIIGCGNVVERKSGPSIQRAERSEIAALMRRDEAKLRAVAESFGVSAFTNNAQEVIHSLDVDIVYVATPPNSHAEYVLSAAEAGKHVLVEKPMGMSAAEGERMIAACDHAGVELFVAYYRRFQPHVMKMRELIREGRIGKPVQAFIDISCPIRDYSPERWRNDPEIGGGGPFVDIGSHRLDVMAYLLGEAHSVCGVTTTFDRECRVEQAVSLSIRFKSGAQCTAVGDYYSGRHADRFTIIGTEATIESERLDGHAFVLKKGQHEEAFRFDPYPAPHLGLIRHVENVLLDGAPNETSGRAALVTEKILDAVVRKG